MKLPYAEEIKLLLKMAVVALVLFGGFKAYRMGEARVGAEWSLKYQALQADVEHAANVETSRQAAEARRARERERELVATLNQEAEAREARIKEAYGQALADRNAGRECLGTDSLRRINKATPGSG